MSSWIKATRGTVTLICSPSSRETPARGNWCTRMREDRFSFMSEYEPRLGATESDDSVIEPSADTIEVSVVMPCLNEADTLAVCIQKAQQAFQEHRINGEIVIADNGSTDGSQAIAHNFGVRVVEI